MNPATSLLGAMCTALIVLGLAGWSTPSVACSGKSFTRFCKSTERVEDRASCFEEVLVGGWNEITNRCRTEILFAWCENSDTRGYEVLYPCDRSDGKPLVVCRLDPGQFGLFPEEVSITYWAWTCE